MTTAAIVELLLQVLPLLVQDGAELATFLDTASTAVKNAQANGGTVSAADWATLDAQRAAAEAAFKAAAG